MISKLSNKNYKNKMIKLRMNHKEQDMWIKRI